MCLLIAIYLWFKYGGTLMILLHKPWPHVVVISESGIRHGTTKTGKWTIEELDKTQFSKWLVRRVKNK